MEFDPPEYDTRFEWGLQGLAILAPVSDLVIIVDVLSFSTCVDIATSKGAFVYPYQWKDSSASVYAQSVRAELAGFERTRSNGFSLSPSSLLDILAGTRLVLPSPNGSVLSLFPTVKPVVCGCLRNAKAVAAYAMENAKKITVIAAGEKWPDGPMRVALEDLIGAGAILSYLQASMSPEARSAVAVFGSVKNDITTEIKQCNSGKELIERGFETDVELACQLNSSSTVPVLKAGFYCGLRTQYL